MDSLGVHHELLLPNNMTPCLLPMRVQFGQLLFAKLFLGILLSPYHLLVDCVRAYLPMVFFFGEGI